MPVKAANGAAPIGGGAPMIYVNLAPAVKCGANVVDLRRQIFAHNSAGKHYGIMSPAGSAYGGMLY